MCHSSWTVLNKWHNVVKFTSITGCSFTRIVPYFVTGMVAKSCLVTVCHFCCIKNLPIIVVYIAWYIRIFILGNFCQFKKWPSINYAHDSSLMSHWQNVCSMISWLSYVNTLHETDFFYHLYQHLDFDLQFIIPIQHFLFFIKYLLWSIMASSMF